MRASRLDGISRVLAGGLSRRQALRQLGVVMVAGGATLVEPEVAGAAPAGKCAKGSTQCCVCVSTSIDPNNCGACGHVCTLANATAKCVSGTCEIASCNAGFADCNGVASDGCEVNINTDPNNCGSCGVKCSSDQTCVNGACTGALANGATCVSNSQCSSGACVPSAINPNVSICCATACTVAGGCSTTGSCVSDGSACQVALAGTTCGGSCTQNQFTPPGACDGAGHCLTGSPILCFGATPICDNGLGCVQCNVLSDCPPGSTQCTNHICS